MLLRRNRQQKLLSAMIGLLGGAALLLNSGSPITETYIIQGQDLTSVQAAVQAAGGEITHELGIINAVGATLEARQVDQLRAQDPHIPVPKILEKIRRQFSLRVHRRSLERALKRPKKKPLE